MSGAATASAIAAAVPVLWIELPYQPLKMLTAQWNPYLTVENDYKEKPKLSSTTTTPKSAGVGRAVIGQWNLVLKSFNDLPRLTEAVSDKTCPLELCITAYGSQLLALTIFIQ